MEGVLLQHGILPELISRHRHNRETHSSLLEDLLSLSLLLHANSSSLLEGVVKNRLVVGGAFFALFDGGSGGSDGVILAALPLGGGCTFFAFRAIKKIIK